MALRGAHWVLSPSTMLPHRAKRRAEVGAVPAATGARQQAPWAPPRDARAAWQMWWTHWNNARWRSWSKMSQKVSDERRRLCSQMCDLQVPPPCLWLYAALLLHSVVPSPIFLSVLFTPWLCLPLPHSSPLLWTHTHIHMRGEPLFFQHTDKTTSAAWAYCPPHFAYLSQPDK